MSDQVPPHDLNAERAVLGAIWLDARQVALVEATLRPGMFYRRKHRQIYEAMCALYHVGEPIDVVTLPAEMRRRGWWGDEDLIGEISTLGDVGLSSRARFYAEILRDLHAVRRTIVAAQEIVNRGLAGRDEPRAFLEEARTSIGRAAASIVDADAAVTALQGARAALEAALDKRKSKELIPIGIAGARIERGVVSVIGGRPSNFKTATAMCILNNVARQGYVCLGMSLEDSTGRWFRRNLACHSGIALSRLRDQEVDLADHSRLVDAANRIGELPLTLCGKKGLTAEYIRAYAAAHKAEHGLDLLVVDYIQLIEGPGKDETEMLNRACKQFVAAAEELDAAVLLVSQIKRPADGKVPPPPTMFDLKQTSALEQAGKWVGLLHYPALYDDSLDPHSLMMIVAKESDGQPGRRNLYCDGATMHVGDRDAAVEGY